MADGEGFQLTPLDEGDGDSSGFSLGDVEMDYQEDDLADLELEESPASFCLDDKHGSPSFVFDEDTESDDENHDHMMPTYRPQSIQPGCGADVFSWAEHLVRAASSKFKDTLFTSRLVFSSCFSGVGTLEVVLEPGFLILAFFATANDKFPKTDGQIGEGVVVLSSFLVFRVLIVIGSFGCCSQDFLNAAKMKLRVPGKWGSEAACENDRVCQRIIQERSGHVHLVADIFHNFASWCSSIPWTDYVDMQRQVQTWPIVDRCPCCGDKRPEILCDVGGSPCQPHSRAGKRLGRNDPRTIYLLLWCRYHTARRTCFMFHEILGYCF